MSKSTLGEQYCLSINIFIFLKFSFLEIYPYKNLILNTLLIAIDTTLSQRMLNATAQKSRHFFRYFEDMQLVSGNFFLLLLGQR